MANWDVGLDFGSAGLRICARGQSGFVSAPSLSVVRQKDGALLAVGDEAAAMEGRLSRGFRISRPVLGGAIEDMDTARDMLGAYFQKMFPGRRAKQISVLAAHRPGIRRSDIRALADCLLGAGAKLATLIPSPLPCALGALSEPSQSRTRLLIDIGAGQSCAIAFAGGYVVGVESIPTGAEMVEAEILRLLREQDLNVGPRTAREIVHALGQVAGPGSPPMETPARKMSAGLPVLAQVSSDTARQAAAPHARMLAQGVRGLLSRLTPQQSGDLSGQTALLCGGGARLGGLIHLLSEGMPFTFALAQDPEGAVIQGLFKMISADSFRLLEAQEFRPEGQP